MQANALIMGAFAIKRQRLSEMAKTEYITLLKQASWYEKQKAERIAIEFAKILKNNVRS